VAAADLRRMMAGARLVGVPREANTQAEGRRMKRERAMKRMWMTTKEMDRLIPF